MKKNTLILIALFAVLGAAAFYLLKNKNTKSTLQVAADQDFAVPAKDVYKVFLADKRNRKVTVERQGDKWIVNGKYNAKKDVIGNCLQAIEGVKLKYITATSTHKAAIEDLAAHGIKVEVYGKNDVKLKTYYVGNNDNEGSGTFYIMENAETPHVMNIPFFYGELQPRFPLAEDDWRDRTIFEAEIEDIQSASVEYPSQKTASFKIENDGGTMRVLPFYTGVPQKQNQRKGKAENFLYGFKSIVAEAIENNNRQRDSFIRLEPFTVISLKTKKGEEMAIRLYPLYGKDADGNTVRGVKAERYFAYSNKGDFYLVQDGVFRTLFWDYKTFFE